MAKDAQNIWKRRRQKTVCLDNMKGQTTLETSADGKSNTIETGCSDIKQSHMIRERFRMRVVTDTVL
jgi:hypothetical protein